MSTPSRPFVTIDDPITIVEPHRVLLEWVEAVHRDTFTVRSYQGTKGPPAAGVYRHDTEGTTWARGHHLPDSDVVVALRAATRLGRVHEEAREATASWTDLITWRRS